MAKKEAARKTVAIIGIFPSRKARQDSTRPRKKPKAVVGPERAYAKRGDLIEWVVVSIDPHTRAGMVCVEFEDDDNPLVEGNRVCAAGSGMTGSITATVKENAKGRYEYSVIADDVEILDPVLIIGN